MDNSIYFSTSSAELNEVFSYNIKTYNKLKCK